MFKIDNFSPSNGYVKTFAATSKLKAFLGLTMNSGGFTTTAESLFQPRLDLNQNEMQVTGTRSVLFQPRLDLNPNEPQVAKTRRWHLQLRLLSENYYNPKWSGFRRLKNTCVASW